MTGSRLRLAIGAILFLAAAGCPAPRRVPDSASPTSAPDTAPAIYFLGATEESEKFRNASRLAIEEVNRDASPENRIRLVTEKAFDLSKLSELPSDDKVLGALTFRGRESIAAARLLLDTVGFPVFELHDDLYESADLGDSIFQMTTPHSWEAWRLARYFGPGDRGYRKVGLVRADDADGEIASAVLADALRDRRVEFVDTVAAGDQGQVSLAIGRLREARVDAVVLSGPASPLALSALIEEPARYLGKDRIRDGWRPQIAGFHSLMIMRADFPAGVVASEGYARASGEVDRIEAVRTFREALEKRFVTEAQGDEAAAYDAIRAIVEAFRRSKGEGRMAVLASLESFDRVRFAGIPLSFGPTDHVGPERDHLGLWARSNSSPEWTMLQRTFTSDLERTNILEEDWPAFFDGTTPGGEAPFYFTAKSGVVTDKSDLLH